MNQTQMSKELGCSQAHVSRIFSGHGVGKKTLQKIAKIAGGKWQEYTELKGSEIEQRLQKAFKKRNSEK